MVLELKIPHGDGWSALRPVLPVLATYVLSVAERVTGSSQSRVAKMEAADRTVSTDLLRKSLFTLGASPRDVAKRLAPNTRNHAA